MFLNLLLAKGVSLRKMLHDGLYIEQIETDLNNLETSEDMPFFDANIECSWQHLTH
jgi:hypothetical protein